MEDVDAGRIDTVVVYKVDRLTRSLADFAKIVERLDAIGASFVSVTQAFNTTTSMGRLTLNVLLSFAQFEREVTGERIRDKIAASKAKGMWMGGVPPLGYDPPTDLLTRALVVNPPEAERVRLIFDRYLALGSVSALEADMARSGIRSKAWRSRQGRDKGDQRFSRGALYHLLKNRLYLGEITHGSLSYPGAHPPIVDQQIFGLVQARLADQRRVRRERPKRVATMPLRGLLFDVDGNPMSPSFTYAKGGRIYRYYISAPLQQGRSPRPNPDAIRRIAAGPLEDLVRARLAETLGAPADKSLTEMIGAAKRIQLDAETISLTLLRKKVPRAAIARLTPHETDERLVVLELDVRCRVRGGRTWIITPAGAGAVPLSRRDPSLIRGLQRAHRLVAAMGWSGADGSIKSRASKSPVSAYDRKLCRLALLAPEIQRAILRGRQPADLTLDQLMNEPIPLAWSEQMRLFSLAD